jgi:hypothetical protein
MQHEPGRTVDLNRTAGNAVTRKIARTCLLTRTRKISRVLSHEATVEKVAQKMHKLGQLGVQFATFPETVMPTTRTFPQSRRASIEQPEMLGAG